MLTTVITDQRLMFVSATVKQDISKHNGDCMLATHYFAYLSVSFLFSCASSLKFFPPSVLLPFIHLHPSTLLSHIVTQVGKTRLGYLIPHTNQAEGPKTA